MVVKVQYQVEVEEDIEHLVGRDGGSCGGSVVVTAQTYPITVGVGGGGKGSGAIFSTITSTGGGRGRHYVGT